MSDGGEPRKEGVLETADGGAGGLELAVERATGPAPVAVASLVSRVTDEPVVAPEDAKRFAKFPPEPDAWWKLPGYARAMRARLGELETRRVAQVVKSNDATAAFEALDPLLVSVAQRGIVTARHLTRAAKAAHNPALDLITSKERVLKQVDPATGAELEARRERVDALETRLREAAAALEEAQRSVTAEPKPDAPQLAAARARLAEAERAFAALRKEREAFEKGVPSLTGEASPEATAARADYLSACRVLADGIVADATSFGLPFEDARKRVLAIRGELATAQRELALVEAALSAYDMTLLERGKKITAAAVVVIVLVVALLVVALAR